MSNVVTFDDPVVLFDDPNVSFDGASNINAPVIAIATLAVPGGIIWSHSR